MRGIWRPEKDLPAGVTLLTSVRESGFYRGSFKLLKHYLLPSGFGVLALFAIIYGGITVVNRTVFAVLDAHGVYCESFGPPVDAGPSYSRELTFDPKIPCWPTHLTVTEGETYRIVMTVDDNWKDKDIPANVHGITGSMPWYLQPLSWPNKRYIFENYLKPVARITPGKRMARFSAGQDEYVLDPAFTGGANAPRCLVSDFVAQSSGELFLYVNDAVLWLWPDVLVKTYANNGGTAKVHVRRIVMQGEAFKSPSGTAACTAFEATPPPASKG
jgi:hypothetical protein